MGGERLLAASAGVGVGGDAGDIQDELDGERPEQQLPGPVGRRPDGIFHVIAQLGRSLHDDLVVQEVDQPRSAIGPAPPT